MEDVGTKKVLKSLDFSQSKFMANGKEYSVTQKLSIERWRKYEELQMLLGFGRTFDEVFSQLKKLWEAIQAGKHGDEAIICHNLLTGIGDKLEKRHHPALLMCTLFINRKDEDPTKYDETVMNEKIKDWQEEGYDINVFFQIAWNLVPSFIEAFNEDFRNTSKNLTQKKSGQSKKNK